MTHTGENEVRIGPRGVDLAVMRMVSMRNCALLSRHLGSRSALPGTLQELRALGEGAGDALRMGCQNHSIEGADAHSLVHEGRRFTYRVDSAAQSFEIESRPVEYGASGVNSYLLRSDGGVHLTQQQSCGHHSRPDDPGLYLPGLELEQHRAEPLRPTRPPSGRRADQAAASRCAWTRPGVLGVRRHAG